MAANGDSSIMPLISENQIGPSLASNTPSGSLPLERKLQVLQRSQYLRRFKALQVGNLSITEIKESFKLLMLDHLSIFLRTDAIIALAIFLWPPTSWLSLRTRSASSRVIYLQVCPLERKTVLPLQILTTYHSVLKETEAILASAP